MYDRAPFSYNSRFDFDGNAYCALKGFHRALVTSNVLAQTGFSDLTAEVRSIQNLAIRSDEGLALETSTSQPF